MSCDIGQGICGNARARLQADRRRSQFVQAGKYCAFMTGAAADFSLGTSIFVAARRNKLDMDLNGFLFPLKRNGLPTSDDDF